MNQIKKRCLFKPLREPILSPGTPESLTGVLRFKTEKKAAKNGRTRFKIDFNDVGDSQKIGRTSCKRDDSKKVFHKTVLLSSGLSAHLISA